MPEARRAKAAGIAAEIGCYTFRAAGITAYLAKAFKAEPHLQSGMRCLRREVRAAQKGAFAPAG